MISHKNTQDRCVVIIPTFNGSRLLEDCLTSLQRSTNKRFTVVVVDDFSSDPAAEEEFVRRWFASSGTAGGLFTSLWVASEESFRVEASKATALFFVRSSRNRGFAGAINVGLRGAMDSGLFSCAWLLNNDTVVDPGALEALLEVYRDFPNSGAIGSKLRYFDQPEKINLIGGRMDRSLAGFGYRPVGLLEIDTGQYDFAVQIDTPGMASCLVPTDVFRKVGFMREDYFLYFEDVEWFERAKGRGFTMNYAHRSLVFHKESATTKKASFFSSYYHARNKVFFYRTYFVSFKDRCGLALSVVRALIGSVRRFSWGAVRGILAGTMDAVRGKTGKCV